MEKEVQEKLDQVIASLKEQGAVVEYQKRKEDLLNRDDLQTLLAKTEQAQKDVVKLEHYKRPNASKTASKQADDYHQQIDSDREVIAYREALYEANELLQYLTWRIETAINQCKE